MSQLADAPTLVAQLRRLAVRAGFSPGMPGRDPQPAIAFFYACNLVSRQAQYGF
jgi:hypothetical protein